MGIVCGGASLRPLLAFQKCFATEASATAIRSRHCAGASAARLGNGAGDPCLHLQVPRIREASQTLAWTGGPRNLSAMLFPLALRFSPLIHSCGGGAEGEGRGGRGGEWVREADFAIKAIKDHMNWVVLSWGGTAPPIF